MKELLTAIAYLLKDASSVVCLVIIMRFIFLNKLKLSVPRIVFVCLAAVFNAFFGIYYLQFVYDDYKSVMDLISNVICVISLYILTDSKKLSRNILVSLLCLFSVDMFYSFVAAYTGDIIFVECLLNTLAFVFIAVFIKTSAQRSEINFLPKVFEEIPKWIYAVILLFELTCYYKEFGISSSWYNALYVFSSFSVTGCVMYLIFKIFWLVYRQNDILRQMQIQKDFGEQTVIGDDELRRFRHDYKNHMIVVNSYLEYGKVEEARKYLEAVNESIRGVIEKIKTGNFVSDAILNNKSVCAAKDGIKIIFSGNIPNKGIKNEDLCTVLANLTDNAIEACRKQTENKTVYIEAGRSNGYFILSVSNPFNKYEYRGLRTSKADRKNHGWGLKNVERVIKKYGGALVTEAKDGIFTADVRMKIGEAETE